MRQMRAAQETVLLALPLAWKDAEETEGASWGLPDVHCHRKLILTSRLR